jgi:UDP-glucuronate decarboxylase
VDDLVDGLVELMRSNDEVTGPLNLGNPEEFTIAELAERILKLTGSKSGIEYLPLPEDDPSRRRPDITAARDALSWHPKVPLEVGLVSTVNYFRSLLQSQSAG